MIQTHLSEAVLGVGREGKTGSFLPRICYNYIRWSLLVDAQVEVNYISWSIAVMYPNKTKNSVSYYHKPHMFPFHFFSKDYEQDYLQQAPFRWGLKQVPLLLIFYLISSSSLARFVISLPLALSLTTCPCTVSLFGFLISAKLWEDMGKKLKIRGENWGDYNMEKALSLFPTWIHGQWPITR